jgi:UDP-3-O-[3-hydroxymyristoyl] glucosamine N-acyltransferase
VIVPASAVEAVPEGVAIITSGEAQAAWARASLLLHRARTLDAPATREEACEDDSVILEPGVVLGQGVRIGRGTRIGANTVIGPGVQIGRDGVIGSNASLGSPWSATG